MGISFQYAISRLREYLENSMRRAYGNPLAGVLIPLYEKSDETYVLLTERSTKLRKHSGQISFPGGTVEHHDLDIFETALRETKEEIGLDKSEIDIIGSFHDFATPYYSAVTPIIGTFEYPQTFELEEAEIERILEVPLSDLLDPEIHHTERWEHDGKHYTLHFFDWTDKNGNNFNIWGATAGVLYELLEVLDPDATQLL